MILVESGILYENTIEVIISDSFYAWFATSDLSLQFT